MNTILERDRPQARAVRFLFVGVVVALSLVAAPTQAVADPTEDASVTVWLTNQSRADSGLSPLTPDRDLQVLANRQASRMAESGYIFHTEDLGDRIGWGWQAWAENVGFGPSVEMIHPAFMNSWHHQSNILNPAYNYVGVGVAYGGDGRVFVAVVFGAW